MKILPSITEGGGLNLIIQPSTEFEQIIANNFFRDKKIKVVDSITASNCFKPGIIELKSVPDETVLKRKPVIPSIQTGIGSPHLSPAPPVKFRSKIIEPCRDDGIKKAPEADAFDDQLDHDIRVANTPRTLDEIRADIISRNDALGKAQKEIPKGIPADNKLSRPNFSEGKVKDDEKKT